MNGTTMQDSTPRSRISDGITISGLATHWRCKKRVHASGDPKVDWERCQWGVTSEGAVVYEWPIEDFTMSEVRKRWGAGSYEVNFRQFTYDPKAPIKLLGKSGVFQLVDEEPPPPPTDPAAPTQAPVASAPPPLPPPASPPGPRGVEGPSLRTVAPQIFAPMHTAPTPTMLAHVQPMPAIAQIETGLRIDEWVDSKAEKIAGVQVEHMREQVKEARSEIATAVQREREHGAAMLALTKEAHAQQIRFLAERTEEIERQRDAYRAASLSAEADVARLRIELEAALSVEEEEEDEEEEEAEEIPAPAPTQPAPDVVHATAIPDAPPATMFDGISKVIDSVGGLMSAFKETAPVLGTVAENLMGAVGAMRGASRSENKPAS